MSAVAYRFGPGREKPQVSPRRPVFARPDGGDMAHILHTEAA